MGQFYKSRIFGFYQPEQSVILLRTHHREFPMPGHPPALQTAR